MTFTSFNFFSSGINAVTDEPMKGPNVSSEAISSIYGWFVKQMGKIFPQSTKQEIIEKFPHPQMCVIGCESTGKSATIESMTKVPMFPTDSGICTRCPIRVVMIPIDESDSHYTVEYKGTLVAEYNEDNCSSIKDRVASIFKDIHNSTELGYSSDEITITIERKDVIRMDFIDLPGIVSYPPEARQFTLNLSSKYIENPNSFILCVANATTPRLTSYEPIARIINAKACDRSIVVLPMADKLATRDLSTHLVDRVLQVSDELKGHTFSACCAVVNRAESVDVTLQEQTKIESCWFESRLLSPVQNMVSSCENFEERAELQKRLKALRGRVGIRNLVRVANMKYEEYVKANWLPRTIEDIKKTIIELDVQEQSLGEIVTEEMLTTVFQDAWHVFVQMLSTSILSMQSIETTIIKTSQGQSLNEMTPDSVWNRAIVELEAKLNHPDLFNHKGPMGNMDKAPYCFQRFHCLREALNQTVVIYLEKHLRTYYDTLFPGSIFPQVLGSPQPTPTPLYLILGHIYDGLIDEVHGMLTMELMTEDEETAKLRADLLKKIELHNEVMKNLQKKMK